MNGYTFMAIGVVAFLGFLSVAVIMDRKENSNRDPVAQRIEQVRLAMPTFSETPRKDALIREVLEKAKPDTVYRDTCIGEMRN